MSKAAEELLAHADRIESGDVVWVPHCPYTTDEVCVAYHRDLADNSLEWLSYEARSCLATAVSLRGITVPSFTTWNDHVCSGSEDAVKLIREAADIAERAI